ncbi:MAG TPA: hypothetical protein VGR72_06490 [Candidatus Acidoferrales bacterium]|nr:hypothetical protein [Candidatus Acidoferrales bacterium]HEV2340498.1 hypothetical protein [Candidatus Acidoferrales bacterium]
MPVFPQDQRVTMRSAYSTQLDAGFHELYELRFDAARADFSAFEGAHPGDPVGKAAQAASYLYEEFHRKGVFTSAYFLDDKKFLGGIPGAPDKPLCDKFLELDTQAKAGAQRILESNPRDASGLLALTLADGMMADYDEVIAKRQFASLHSMRQAEADAARLLAVDPGAADADVAIGAANYVLGSLPAYKRAFLWLGGIYGDRVRGMNQLHEAALHGHYLKPLAEVLLALASLREHHPDEARNLFLQLSHDFPQNPVFSSELATAEKMAARN